MKAVYDHYANYFFSIALRYSTDSHEAEDYVQEAFMRIFKNVKSFQFKGSFEGWMKRILVNHCLNGVKKNNVLKHHAELTDHMSEMHTYSSDILENITSEDIIDCIQDMPIGYKTVLNMYVIEGFSHREIGDKLGIKESSSRSQLTKARAKLKTLLVAKGLYTEGQLVA